MPRVRRVYLLAAPFPGKQTVLFGAGDGRHAQLLPPVPLDRLGDRRMEMRPPCPGKSSNPKISRGDWKLVEGVELREGTP